MTETTMLRVAISASIDDSLLYSFPNGVEVIRYNPDGFSQAGPHTGDSLDVDMLVLPNFGKQAADALSHIHARYIQAMSAGVELVQPLVPPGSILCNAQGVHNSSTAEWALTAILASLKWLPFYASLQQRGHWGGRAECDSYWQQTYGASPAPDTPSTATLTMVEELANKTVLIVGYGSIGKSIEARLLPFEPRRIIRLARTAREGIQGVAELDSVLPEADIVILITPLTPETRHLIGRRQLALMRRGAFLINAARGGIIDTDALVEALEARHIRAALDVTDPEPLPSGHPLWKVPGLLLTPHIAGSTPDFLKRVFRFVGRQLERLQQGQEPENIIHGSY